MKILTKRIKKLLNPVIINNSTLAKQTGERFSLSLLFIYLTNSLLFCKNKNKLNINYRLLNSVANLYRRVISVDTIMLKSYEVELMKRYLKVKIDLNNEEETFKKSLC